MRKQVTLIVLAIFVLTLTSGLPTRVQRLFASAVQAQPPIRSAAPLESNASQASSGSITFLTGPNAGKPLEIALSYVRSHAQSLGLNAVDLSDIVVKDQVVTKHNGVTHIYLRQRVNGIEVFHADMTVNIGKNGEVISIGNRFLSNLSISANTAIPKLSAVDAVKRSAEMLALPMKTAPAVVEAKGGSSNETIFAESGISQNRIPVKLLYQPTSDGQLRLVWDTVIRPIKGSDWWNLRIDATDGSVLAQDNWVRNDPVPADKQVKVNAPPMSRSVAITGPVSPLTPPLYQVFPIPFEHPGDSPGVTTTHQTVFNPADLVASPYNWHDIDATPGHEFDVTKGNNVSAQEDQDANDFGGLQAQELQDQAMNFVFAFDPLQDPRTPENQRASITNLFYWNNLIHDILYQYGFDENSGNFQVHTYSRGGLGNDPVQADTQDGSGFNNANFGTPPDGLAPRMQMYLFSFTSPLRDSSFDNGIVIHEYGHGVSNRLTGGPSNVSCLFNAEQMGEGWSDWLTLAMTVKAGDSADKARGVGTYVLGQANDGPGIRRYRYSTNMSINPLTYDDIRTNPQVHDLGEVWAVMLWEMYWKLVEKHGYDPDIYRGAGGNNLALRLVMDGMKFQPCSPGFVDGRNAILLADQADTGGANQCLIWEAFAKRGLGASAIQGSSFSTSDNQQAFDLPRLCIDELQIGKSASPKIAIAGQPLTYQLAITNFTTSDLNNVVVSDLLPAGVTYVPGSASDGGAFNGTTVAWPALTLPLDQVITRSFQVLVNPDAPSLLLNKATVSSQEGRSSETTLATTVIIVPEIEVIPSSLEETLIGGQKKTQTLLIRNTGLANLQYEIVERGFTSPLASPDATTGPGTPPATPPATPPMTPTLTPPPCVVAVSSVPVSIAALTPTPGDPATPTPTAAPPTPTPCLPATPPPFPPTPTPAGANAATKSDTQAWFVPDKATALQTTKTQVGVNALTSTVKVDVLLLLAANGSRIQSVLRAYPDIGLVDYYDARFGTPTLEQLLAYDVVIVGSNNSFQSPILVGDLLADFIDQGGSVVQTTPTFYDPFGNGWGLRGRYITDGYSPFFGFGDWFSPSFLGAFDANHPIMRGVRSAGDSLRQRVDPTFHTTVIASWTDDEYVAIKGNVVALNSYVGDFGSSSGDADLIVHNSVIWLGGSLEVPWLNQSPRVGTIPSGGEQLVTIEFDSSVPEVDKLGDYSTTLRIRNNDPDEASLDVPVVMHVLGPELTISEVDAFPGRKAKVTIKLDTKGLHLSATAFSLDFDQSCLSFDARDTDKNGVPDGITIFRPDGFRYTTAFDPLDEDGEIDISFYDPSLPLGKLPDAVLATVEFHVTCQPAAGGEVLKLPVRFSTDPKPSISDDKANSLLIGTINGSINVQPVLSGDCNRDKRVDAADTIACVLEIRDGDGGFWLDAAGGTFAGSPHGCDSNRDERINAGDLTCTAQLIFNRGFVCGPLPVLNAAAQAEGSSVETIARLAIGTVSVPNAGSTIDLPIRLSSAGQRLAAASFAIRFDPARLYLDPTDADGDSVPDAVKLNIPADYLTSVEYDAATGVLTFILADITLPMAPLSDGDLATVTLIVNPGSEAGEIAISFADTVDTSLGSESGAAAPLTTENGAVQIVPPATATPVATDTPVATATPLAVATEAPTATIVPVVDSATPTPTPGSADGNQPQEQPTATATSTLESAPHALDEPIKVYMPAIFR